MLPNPGDLIHFLEVAQTQNMSRAAERLGITQPALSQSVKRLEHNFGQQLLLRSKSGVSLTKVGSKLVLGARELLDSWEKLKEDTQKEMSHIKGRYSIGFHSSVALYTSPLFVSQIMQKYPLLDLKFAHDLSRKVTEDIISFKIDFGIVVNPVNHPDLVIKELFKDEVGFWRSKKVNPNNDLKSESGVLVVEPDLNQTQVLMGKLSKKKIHFKRTITSSNLEVIKTLVLSGVGIGVIPGRIVGADTKKMEYLKNLPVFQDRICLVYRADAQKGHAARLLAKEIADHLKK